MSLSRRQFLERAAALAAVPSLVATPRWLPAAESTSPNEKLDLAIIGVAGQGEYNTDNVTSENIVALCDIDEQRLAKAAERFPKARTFKDYRQLLDQQKLDGVVIATPDHSHAIPAVRALRQGLHVYCEKPLAHDVYEVRQIREAAKHSGKATQMGTQIHAENNYRRVVELIRSGTIGKVQRVHVWLNGGTKPGKRVRQSTPPAYVDYDLWTGPAPLRPFDESHFHFNWRYWYDFGNGVLGDFGCHYMDLPFWALELQSPTTVVARGEKTYAGDNDVPDNMQVDYQFAALGDRPPVHLTWYHGRWRPEGAEAYGKGSAVLFEGEEGRVLSDYGSHQVFLQNGKDVVTPPQTIPNSIGHHAEWIKACKTGSPTTCNFDYSGGLTEAVLLGNVSYLAGGKLLEWDAEKLAVSNVPGAAKFLRREYREGWSL
jgi:predicted dehydrogenase